MLGYRLGQRFNQRHLADVFCGLSTFEIATAFGSIADRLLLAMSGAAGTARTGWIADIDDLRFTSTILGS
jgi:hypothetical protein